MPDLFQNSHTAHNDLHRTSWGEGKIGPLALFFFPPPERNLTSCLAVIRLIYLFIFPKKRVLLRYFIPNLLLMGHSQYCKHCYAKLLLLCVYCALQGEVATFQKWRPCCVIFFTRALLLDISWSRRNCWRGLINVLRGRETSPAYIYDENGS